MLVQTDRTAKRGGTSHLLAKFFLACTLGSLMSPSAAVSVTQESSTELPEMELISDLSIGDKSFAYFNLTVTENTFTWDKATNAARADTYLTITTYATSYNSDPDIYISKSEHVNTQAGATWHSTREGTDTTIIHSDEFAIGDTLFITVACMNECTYDLRSFYSQIFDLKESERMVFRWGGHVTNILRYQVPDDGLVDKFEIKIEPEVDYKFIEVYVSHDPKFNVIEDKPASHITDDGLSVLMTDKDTRWCINCYVYVIVNMIEDRRIYVTAESLTTGRGIQAGIQNFMLVNEGHFECELYSIGSSTFDALFSFDNFQGDANFYLARRTEPTSPQSSSIVLETKSSYPQQVMIASKIDREYWSAQLGIYYLCANAYDALSAEITVNEGLFEGKLAAAQLDTLYNFYLHSTSAMQFVFEQSELPSVYAQVEIEAEVFQRFDDDDHELSVFYKLCTTDYCFMTAEEEVGQGEVEKLTLTAVATDNTNGVAQKSSQAYKAVIQHAPTSCLGAAICKYTMSLYNPSPLNTPRLINFKTHVTTKTMQDIVPGQSYVNSIKKGQYVNYRILDSQFDLDNIYRVTLDLKTYLGDADLFVSNNQNNTRPTKDNYTYLSCQKDHFDQIILTDSVNNWLSDYIYISVYGELYSEFELNISVEYHPILDNRLVGAQPLSENISVFNRFTDEFGSAFYSYRPWWSMHENKSIIMLADSPEKSITFYSARDDYPLIYMTNWVDSNEMFALQPTDAGYGDANGHFGSYYVRVRPSYNIADLLIDDPYSYFFRAFSQPAGDGQTDLYANQTSVGVAYKGQSTFYRHFITDPEQTIRITLERLRGKGLPQMMVKFANIREQPRSNVPQSYDQKQDMTLEQLSVTIDMNKEWRATQGTPDCDYAGYWKNGASELCSLYIGVECQDQNDDMCAFKITLDLYTERENPDTKAKELFPVQLLPPRYIPRDQDYVDVSVPYKTHANFYYPVLPQESGDLLIFANKTGSIGKNGDVTLLLNIQTNSTKPYKEWNIPTSPHVYNSVMSSQTKDAVQPEMIDICQEKLEEVCKTGEDCSLLISLYGETNNTDSDVRLRVFNGTNKLFAEKPITGTSKVKGEFKYYWFVSTGAHDQIEDWQHTIAMGIKTLGADFDLFVSVMDGRYPTENDYDFKSTNLGADSIFLSSDDPVFQHSNPDSWDPKVGMVVVVGVKSLNEGEADFSLAMNGPKKVTYEIIEINTNEAETFSLAATPDAATARSADNPKIQIFKWYNWGHGNFQLQVKAFSGVASFYLNRVSETSYEENGFSAIGLNANSAEWGVKLYGNSTDGGDLASISLTREDTQKIPQFCYNCWYFVTVIVDDPQATEYRVWIQNSRDTGTEMLELSQSKATSFSLSETAEKKYFKFILGSTESFQIQVLTGAGEVRVNIGLNPDNIDENPLWTLQQGIGPGFIEVATDNPNFHFGTYYYMSIEQLDAFGASGSLSLSQLRNVQFMANGVTKKLQFTYARELVKYVVFTVPQETSKYSRTTIEIQKICAEIYPAIYLKKIELEQAPSRLEDLTYPSLIDYDLKFGDNFSAMINEDKMTYELSTQSQLAHTYYTMAIYQNSYGMTDQRKPEFKLNLKTWEIAAPVQAQHLSMSTETVAQEQENPQPASNNWIQAKLHEAQEFFTQ